MANTQNILTEIVAHKQIEVAERKAMLAQTVLAKDVQVAEQGFYKALSSDRLHLIAEIKPRSPSAGTLRANLDLSSLLPTYNKFASAISVLTDKKYFSGDLDLMASVISQSVRPVLCKDFIIDQYQVLEARKAGAQAVLLIVKILSAQQLANLYRTIVDLGMTPIVEIQNEEELHLALVCDPMVLMVNNRNLEDFSISLETTMNLIPKMPKHVLAISASGIDTRADIEILLPFCQRFLVGSSLMKSDNLEAKFVDLLGT